MNRPTISTLFAAAVFAVLMTTAAGVLVAWYVIDRLLLRVVPR